LGITPVGNQKIYDVACDIFSPCAVGGILNSNTIPRLKCKAVVGGANNQLKTPEDGHLLHKKGILYAPDYAVNSAGIINVYMEHIGYDEAKAIKMADAIYDTMKEIYERSVKENKPPFIIADTIAEERLHGGN